MLTYREDPLLSPQVVTSFQKQPEHLDSHHQCEAVCHGSPPSAVPCHPSSHLVHLFFAVGRVGEGITTPLPHPPRKKANKILSSACQHAAAPACCKLLSQVQAAVTLTLPVLSPPQSLLPQWANPTSATTAAGATNSRAPWRSTRSGATTTCRVSALKPRLWPASQVGLWRGPHGSGGRGQGRRRG